MPGILQKKRLCAEAFWALSGQLASALALLAGTRFLTELVQPEIYGQVALLSGFVALGVAVFAYPFIGAGMRLSPECRDEHERAGLYSRVSNLAARSTAMAMAVLLLAGSAYSHAAHNDLLLFLLAAILLAVTVRRELGIQLLIGERRQRGASVWQTCDSVLRPALAIAMVWRWGAKAEWLLLAYIAAGLLSNSLGAALQGRKIKPNNSLLGRDFGGAVWAYALPLIPMELVFWINGLGDRYAIAYFLTAADVGLYAAAYTLINEAFNRSAMLLLRIFQPAYFQLHSENQAGQGFSLLWLWIGCTLGLGAVGVSLLYLIKDQVAALLLGQTYQAAAALMPAIGMGCALHALGSVLAQPLLAGKRTHLLLLGRLGGALAAVVSLPLMLQQFGLPGAAMANPIYFGVEALILALLAKPWRVVGTESSCESGQTVSAEAGVSL